MADTDRTGSRSVRMTNEEIVQRNFSSKVRGISESEVRTFLRRLADEVTRLGKSEDDLIEQIDELKAQLAAKPKASKTELLESLGEQTTRVLSSAEEAAEQMLADAHEESQATLASAKKESEQMVIDARAQVEQTLSDAQSRVRALQDSSERDSATVISEARTLGREIFQESVVVREQILKDLLRRRDLLLEQIDELRKGREELLESYKVVKGSFQKATDALHSVEEKASSELMPHSIDVDSLLKTPVELPEILDANSMAPIPAYDQNKASETAPEAAQASDEQITEEEIASEESEEQNVERVEEVPSITGKRKALKSYMKGALGVGEEEIGIVPDTQSVDVEPTMPSVTKTTVPQVQEKTQAPKKDVGALFKSLKEQNATSDDVTVGEQSISHPEERSDEGSQKESSAASQSDREKMSKKKAAKKKSSAKTDAVALRNDALADVTSSILRKAKRQLQDEQNELLEALRTVKPKKRVAAENILPDEQTQLKTWETAILADLEEVFTAGAKTVSSEKVSYDSDASKSAVSWIVTPLRETLAVAIDEGEQADATTRVGARYREWRNSELKNALYDALCSAYNNGVLSAAKSDATIKWNVEKAGQCPDCDDNALEPTSAGEAFPTGQVAPPSHSGCRCVVTVA